MGDGITCSLLPVNLLWPRVASLSPLLRKQFQRVGIHDPSSTNMSQDAPSSGPSRPSSLIPRTQTTKMSADPADLAPERPDGLPKTKLAPRGRKRKAGGGGKKGKIFLEDKASLDSALLFPQADVIQSELLSLMSSITDSQDDIAQSKVDKHRARAGEVDDHAVKDKPRAGEKRQRAKADVLVRLRSRDGAEQS